MQKFWLWLLSLFGYKIPTIPDVIQEEATVYQPVDDWEEPDAHSDPLPEPIEREPSKFALIVGINKYDPSLNADLNGCVNDAENMYKVLTEIYNFPSDNVRVLTDFRATGDNIHERLEWLMSHTIPGDELFFHFSGHGSQIRDRNGDELEDQLDEILCPTDLDWDDPFNDDIIGRLFSFKADGVFLTFVCDSCHSGTMSRSTDFSSITPKNPDKPRFINPPFDIRSREAVIKEDETMYPVNKIGKSVGDQNHVLLSGCRDNQTSADAYIDGIWQGALTAALVETIKANPQRDWISIHADIIALLNVNGYTQKPQLSGNEDLIKGRYILGK